MSMPISRSTAWMVVMFSTRSSIALPVSVACSEMIAVEVGIGV